MVNPAKSTESKKLCELGRIDAVIFRASAQEMVVPRIANEDIVDAIDQQPTQPRREGAFFKRDNDADATPEVAAES
jgi:hypothetical protein